MNKKCNVKSGQISLSFCITTYNRSRYLKVLLETFCQAINRFEFSFEIVISDNASLDDTEIMVKDFYGKLPIRYFKQILNKGGANNLKNAQRHAQGVLLMYLADDDLFHIEGLNKAVNIMLKEQNVAAIYAPWTLFDLVNQKKYGEFYQTSDLQIKKNDFATLASHVISKNIWSEICIVRKKASDFCNPITYSLTYWAYTIPCEYLSYGDVLYSNTPFYISVTNYFSDEVRQQAGNLEVEYSWDIYRGGLEYILGRGIPGLEVNEIVYLRGRINQIIIDRMAVALRFRWQNNKDPIEIYQIACRLRGQGGLEMLPVPFENIQFKVVLWYITHDNDLLDGMQSIQLVGGFSKAVKEEVLSQTNLKVYLYDRYKSGISNSMVVLKGQLSEYKIEYAYEAAKGNKFIAESDLNRKFS